MKKIILVSIIMLLTGCTTNEKHFLDELYKDSDEPVLFMDQFISTPNFEHSSLTFGEDNTIYWSRFNQPLDPSNNHFIYTTRYLDNGEFSKVDVVKWNPSFTVDSPYYYDGKIYFHGRERNLFTIFQYDIEKMVMDEIYINTTQSVSNPFKNNEILLFDMSINEEPGTQIMYVDNSTNEPQPFIDGIEDQYINTNPFLSMDSNLFLYASVDRRDGKGAADLYVSFKSSDGTWSEGINLEKVNTSSNERFPSLSPDGKYLFFVSNRTEDEHIASTTLTQNGLGDYYWIKADFIYELNPYK
jgi:hypothetical protein